FSGPAFFPFFNPPLEHRNHVGFFAVSLCRETRAIAVQISTYEDVGLFLLLPLPTNHGSRYFSHVFLAETTLGQALCRMQLQDEVAILNGCDDLLGDLPTRHILILTKLEFRINPSHWFQFLVRNSRSRKISAIISNKWRLLVKMV